MKNTDTFPSVFLHSLVFFLGMILIATIILPMTAFPQSSPAPVILATSGEFVAIAKTGISSTGTTNITGDIGVSPVSATYITGFGLIMDVSNTYSTSSLITGKVYAADYTNPTPSKMTTAIGDMETAYNDAAGRLLPDYNELYLGDLTGKTLTPGLYNWTSGVQVASAGVTISGSATDVWIFQIAQNLVLTSGANVTLSGGAQASNIFWQVAGEVGMGTTVAMKGIILCKTKIVMSTGASLLGRALAQSAVTFDANTVTVPAVINGIGTVGSQIPDRFSLEQNFPNPFNPSTKINYNLPFDSKVTLEIFNVIGKRISLLVNTEEPAGSYSVNFNSFSFNKDISSGVYFYKLTAVSKTAGNNFSSTKKMILLK